MSMTAGDDEDEGENEDDELKRWTVQIVARSQPGKAGYDCRENWNVMAILGPFMSPRSGRHYFNTWPHIRAETLHRLMAWAKQCMCQTIPAMCNALNIARYRAVPSDEHQAIYDLANPNNGILHDERDGDEVDDDDSDKG